MHDFKKFKVWQKARKFTAELYLLTKTFPEDEKFGVTSQIRRATISITNNIAEGCGRNSDKQLVQFLHYSYGSTVEVENLLILVADLKLSNDNIDQLYNDLIEIQKMLFTLIQKFKQ